MSYIQESIMSFVPVLFVIFILGIVYTIHRKSVSAQDVVLENQALKRNGTLKKSRFFSFSQLMIPYQDKEIMVYSMPGGKNTPPYTYMDIKWELAREFSLTVYEETVISKAGKFLGMRDIQVNNPEFDEAFVVKGKDEMLVFNFLTMDIQAQLLAIKVFHPTLSIKKDKFSMYVPQLIKEEAHYDAFIDTGLALISKTEELG